MRVRKYTYPHRFFSKHTKVAYAAQGGPRWGYKYIMLSHKTVLRVIKQVLLSHQQADDVQYCEEQVELISLKEAVPQNLLLLWKRCQRNRKKMEVHFKTPNLEVSYKPTRSCVTRNAQDTYAPHWDKWLWFLSVPTADRGRLNTSAGLRKPTSDGSLTREAVI